MPSAAYRNYLLPLLADAEELENAHLNLRTGLPGRQWGLGGLNRASIVMCLSAWEAYIEELVKESVDAFRPAVTSGSLWQSIKADTCSKVGRFNTPNEQNVKMLISDAIGFADVTVGWTWQYTTQQKAKDLLKEAIGYRHKIAHGVNPRPTIHCTYTPKLRNFFKKLGLATDRAVHDYLVSSIGVTNPWPR